MTMGLDDAPDGGNDTATPPKDTDGTPYCPVHFCRMKQYSGPKGGNRASHYICPVNGCKETGKKVTRRSERAVPSEPTMCPVCKSKKPCRIAPKKSDATKIVLECVECGHTLPPMPTPALLEHTIQSREKP